MGKLKSGFNLVDGKSYFMISQSLIKQFFYKGNLIEFCPYQIKRVSIDKAYNFNTAAMGRGNAFESIAIGSSADSRQHPLERLKTGKLSAASKRIKIQALEFKADAKELGLTINSETTQLEIYKTLKFANGSVIVILKGILDMFSNMKGFKGLLPIDLKLTADVTNTKGKFGWGNVGEMDHLQASFYTFLTNTDKFLYMVYDYKPELEKLVPIVLDVLPVNRGELIEVVRKTVVEISHFEMNGWDKRPDLIDDFGFRKLNKCGRCIVEDCKFKGRKELPSYKY